jgi:hypothetical protein
MRNPLLRSTGLLSGLFYEFVVVTEADADRAFYAEVNERLLRYASDRAIPNCLFINAQNKQTVQTLIRPLRDLGIPAAAIVDIDVLKEGGMVWTSLLKSAFVPELLHSALGMTRQKLKVSFDYSGKDMKRNGGTNILSDQDKEAAQNLFEQLADYGIFVVSSGELESWLKELGATGHGPTWLISMFERMGEDPESGSYVVPDSGDVWEFMHLVRRWLLNSARKGIPK